MRDISRIRRILNKLATIWKHYPDLRFFQLLSILDFPIWKAKDFFYMEDYFFEDILDDKIKELKEK